MSFLLQPVLFLILILSAVMPNDITLAVPHYCLIAFYIISLFPHYQRNFLQTNLQFANRHCVTSVAKKSVYYGPLTCTEHFFDIRT
jgi:hypothetical protein